MVSEAVLNGEGFTVTERPLDMLGISREEVDAEWEEAKGSRPEKRARDGRICVCGHPVSRHTGMPGRMLCKPSRMECPCRNSEPVLETDYTVAFLWRTTGPGAKHALALGLRAAEEKQREVSWLNGALVCRKCERDDARVIPCSVTPSGQVSQAPQKFNALMCQSCISQVGVLQ